MRRWLVAILLLVAALPARAERLVLSLSENEIAIGSNYTGTRLALYGIIERDDRRLVGKTPLDVVVTVRGPRETVTVRQKERVGPVWLNRSQQKFASVPTVLSVAASRRVEEVGTPDLRRRLRLGLTAIVEAPEMTLEEGTADDPFRAALVRLKKKDGLWREEARGVVFVTDGFFRASVPIPATAPTGNYDVEVSVLTGGKLLARRSASFAVVKTGFEESVSHLSQDRSLLYGLSIAVMSLAFGWLASVIFRRD